MADAKSGRAEAANNALDLSHAMLAIRRRKRKIGKAKAEAAEIKFLNIVAMVDVLTILLIFLLKSVSVSNAIMPSAARMQLPFSLSDQNPIDACKVLITEDRILLDNKTVAELQGGALPPHEMAPSDPLLIPDLQAALRGFIATTLSTKPDADRAFNLEIVADKGTPYHILMQVFYTAGKSSVDDAGGRATFARYRLLVMRST